MLAEAIMMAYKIHNAYKKWNDGVVIEFREKFIREVIDIVVLALFRSGGSIAGMFVGQLVIPIPIVGGFVGAVVGYSVDIWLESFSSICSETLARLIESKIAKKDGQLVQSEG